jgi:glycosyltransferase involved in cell wall biosynthesis
MGWKPRFCRRPQRSHQLVLEPGYFLCIARLLPYKNVQVVAEAVGLVPGARLVIVGDGPARSDIETVAGPNVRFLGQVDDATLRWLYRNSVALVSASFEDYGLTPLEAACFGRPSVVLRSGGFLDTVVDGLTGVFFDAPIVDDVARACIALFSDLFPMTTGEILHVDGGVHAVQ